MTQTRRIEFIYFDLGNVLLRFDHRRAGRQIGELVGVSGDDAYRAVFDSGLQDRYERGDLDSQGFHDACRQLFGDCQWDPLMTAAADIFETADDACQLAAALQARGRRLGILSNTCEVHWHFCRERFDVLSRFECYALSYELRSMKPEPLIYERAAELAGVDPSAIFFMDDRPENVAAALDAGYDAVRFTTADALREDLRERALL